MWRWVLEFVGPARREAWDEVGARIYTALGGYVRGIALVGLADALLIGLALLVIGVPLDKVTGLEPHMDELLAITKNSQTHQSWITPITDARV